MIRLSGGKKIVLEQPSVVCNVALGSQYILGSQYVKITR